jgi:acyl-CoA hydrolase
VRQGQLVELLARVVATGNTSLTVEVKLFSENLLTGERKLCTQGRFVLVAVDESGQKSSVLPLDVALAAGASQS